MLGWIVDGVPGESGTGISQKERGNRWCSGFSRPLSLLRSDRESPKGTVKLRTEAKRDESK
ncbi:hypothetical protein Mal15_70070 [Stieleria maiorica]|uniref:Uncharacterized protein n=1 Tax=Stieleria maiorica TaxID=2795974 RepID=A0A5B9MSZ3_9BACT|nr:hypothetical protein Mal15_70070 [Stieleria maiorica]